MKATVISLIGEQPLPNLLPLKYLKPTNAILVYTQRTKEVARRLKTLLSAETQSIAVEVDDPYNLAFVTQKLRHFLKSRGKDQESLLFNVTGGTKPMALAASFVAREQCAPILYFQTEGTQSLLYQYELTKCGTLELKEKIIIPETITIDEYIRSFTGQYHSKKDFPATQGGEFERLVYQALKPRVDEIMPSVILGGALEIDLVIRCGNQVGIAEVKTGKKALSKEGIDQLNTAGGRDFLGIYTKKVLIVDREWDDSKSNLRELAEARHIKIIELPSFSQSKNRCLSSHDQQKLIRTISSLLRCNNKIP